MIFSISCIRDIVGYRIDVQVKAEGSEAITLVSTSYEGSSLADDQLSPPEVQYQRIFSQVGGYTPGVERTVKVTATTDAGKQKTASKRWQD
ncbi:hypothetical protein Geob_2744 [Geotalea daltonii FRC-32]|uniref:Uncharacterized protein n=1 Tax=Geotalea daltonii (strain DSM 22248 / JCM 15807 / FRC-32) TaxID=316067 RepID=B9M1L1_GEODF|nr:hypothetical protein [Geotalea daltonii]ACM21093.1 hypothetical protein Geob_2744 [Geotalea daltonii FRC-32]